MIEHVSGVVGRVMSKLREQQWKNRGAIYVPKGRAREYAEFAVSLYRGCEHGCTYCFAPSQLRMSRGQFSRVERRDGILRKLERDARFMSDLGWDDVRVLMSFTTDPYPAMEEDLRTTRGGIKILHDNGIGVTILSKAGMLCQRDFDLLGEKDEFATTLTYLSDDFKHWEPNAADTMERIANLKKAKELGIRTWVSIEPVFDAKQSFAVIQVSLDYVDEYRIGTLNHHPKAKEINWAEFAGICTSFLERYGKKYVLKRDLIESANLPSK